MTSQLGLSETAVTSQLAPSVTFADEQRPLLPPSNRRQHAADWRGQLAPAAHHPQPSMHVSTGLDSQCSGVGGASCTRLSQLVEEEPSEALHTAPMGRWEQLQAASGPGQAQAALWQPGAGTGH